MDDQCAHEQQKYTVVNGLTLESNSRISIAVGHGFL